MDEMRDEIQLGVSRRRTQFGRRPCEEVYHRLVRGPNDPREECLGQTVGADGGAEILSQCEALMQGGRIHVPGR